MVKVSDVNKRRRNNNNNSMTARRRIWLFPKVLLLWILVLLSTLSVISYFTIFAKSTTLFTPHAESQPFVVTEDSTALKLSVTATRRTRTKEVPRESSASSPHDVSLASTTISLPIWNTTAQTGLSEDPQKKKYGQIPLTGSYTYVDDGRTGCTSSRVCRIHFPFMDLKQMILHDEALQDTNHEITTSPAVLSAQDTEEQENAVVPETDDKDKNNVVKDTEYPPPIFISQRMSLQGNAASHTSYRDFALLTRKGAKEGPNQDRILLLSPFFIPNETTPAATAEIDNHGWVLGLFDGHGRYGHVVSHFCALDLARVLSQQVQQQQQQQEHAPLDMKEALGKTFFELDRMVPSATKSGTTGIVLWRWKDYLAVANAGDSHAYIVRYNPLDQSLEILMETRPHKPDLAEERARIEQHGGKVMEADRPGGTSRVLIHYPNENLITGLAMSRSIGDHDGRAVGVIPKPTADLLDIRKMQTNNDSRRLFAIAATDGLIDYVSPEQVARHLAKSLFQDSDDEAAAAAPTLLEACEQLIMKSSSRWKDNGNSYRDDISIAVIAIK